MKSLSSREEMLDLFCERIFCLVENRFEHQEEQGEANGEGKLFVRFRVNGGDFTLFELGETFLQGGAHLLRLSEGKILPRASLGKLAAHQLVQATGTSAVQ